MNKLISYQLAKSICSRLRADKTIILKTGCFDIVHIGHVIMLQQAKSFADILIVGIGSDETVKKDRPNTYFDENNRAAMIAALNCVDYVIIEKEEAFGNIDHSQLINIVKPDYLFLAADDKSLETKKMLANSAGAEIILQQPVKINNYGTVIEPHSSNLKNL